MYLHFVGGSLSPSEAQEDGCELGGGEGLSSPPSGAHFQGCSKHSTRPQGHCSGKHQLLQVQQSQLKFVDPDQVTAFIARESHLA